MLHDVMPDTAYAADQPDGAEIGAFLGRADIRFVLLSRLHEQGRGAQPIPRLRELCREVARQLELSDHPDLGWPPGLAQLMDALCAQACPVSNQTQLEHMLRLVPPGAQLQPVLIRFLLRLVGDAEQGLIARATGGQIALLRQLQRLLHERLDDNTISTLDWQSVHALIQLQLAAHGRITPPEEHFINLAARAVAEMDAASAVRWTWQAIEHRPGGDCNLSAAALRQWQLDVLIELLQSLQVQND